MMETKFLVKMKKTTDPDNTKWVKNDFTYYGDFSGDWESFGPSGSITPMHFRKDQYEVSVGILYGDLCISLDKLEEEGLLEDSSYLIYSYDKYNEVIEIADALAEKLSNNPKMIDEYIEFIKLIKVPSKIFTD